MLMSAVVPVFMSLLTLEDDIIKPVQHESFDSFGSGETGK